ncbi:hypothetical protein [Okeania sp. SIO1I7]|uniref:hypothetical protein n=1 Tax=Okeania sp. SIO1I7 TaxID=2607772 RepID=UPI0025F52780|nr:hypothetical protein [Okeania sp. SIO1I7]
MKVLLKKLSNATITFVATSAILGIAIPQVKASTSPAFNINIQNLENETGDPDSGLIGGGSIEGFFEFTPETFTQLPPPGEEKSFALQEFTLNFFQSDGTNLFNMPIDFVDPLPGLEATATVKNVVGDDIFIEVSGKDTFWEFEPEITIPVVCNIIFPFLTPIGCNIVGDVTVWLVDENSEGDVIDEHFLGLPENTKITRKTPEATSILSFLALGTLGAASTLKRKLKPSKSPDKELEKVS